MAATRLSDSPKQELVARFRGGEASGALAEAFGCSANTVSRVVRTALDPQDYEALKQQRGRTPALAAGPAGGSSLQLPLPAAPAGEEALPTTSSSPSGDPAPGAPLAASGSQGGAPTIPAEPGARASDQPAQAEPGPAPEDLAPGSPNPGLPDDQPQFAAWVRHQVDGVGQGQAPGLGEPGADLQDSAPGDQGHAALAIDDADDFADEAGDDGESDDESDTDDDGDDGEDGDSVLGSYGDGGPGDGQTFVVLPLGQAIEDRPSLTVQPLEPANLPASVYMLVDKTVELDIKPLKELADLGALPDGEGERQALVVYANPRQAKRYCGRNQRVIKVPDSGVLARTAPYLLSQGVTRLVVEGALYSLPGS